MITFSVNQHAISARVIYNFSIISDVVGLKIDRCLDGFHDLLLFYVRYDGTIEPEENLRMLYPEVCYDLCAQIQKKVIG